MVKKVMAESNERLMPMQPIPARQLGIHDDNALYYISSANEVTR